MTSRLFDLKTSVDELSSNEGITRMEVDRVLPNRSITSLADYTQGQIVFRFGQTASNKWLVRKQCSLEAFLKFAVNAGTQPVVTDLIAPCINAMSTLFQTIEFQINNKRVSWCDAFVAQCDTFLKRVHYSDAYLASCDTEFWGEFGERVSDISSNGFTLHTELGRYVFSTNATPVNVELKGNDIGGDTPPVSLRHFDVNVKYFPDILGILKEEEALPACGDFQIIIQPYQTQTELHACETGKLSVKGTNAFYPSLDIKNLYFNAVYITGPPMNNGEFLLDIESIRCDTRVLTGAAFQQSTFDVPSSTYAVGVAFQGNNLYNANQINGNPSPTIFKAAGYDKENPYVSDEMTLKRLFVQYDNSMYPASDLNLSYGGGVDHLNQLYNYTMQETDAISDPAGKESYKNWLKRGLYMYVNLPKPASSSCTRVVVNNEFTTLTGSTNVLLFSRYRQVVKCVIKDGRYVDIIQSDN